MSVDIASTIKFRDICDLFEKLKATKKVANKEDVLKCYYESFCRHRESFRKQTGLTDDDVENGTSSFYSVLRLLLPSADTGRDNYGLQITALGRLYIRVLQLARDSSDAIMLQHRSGNMYRDYGDVVYAVLKPRCFNPPSNLRLNQIHEMLDTIANEDTTVKEQELIRFTEQASPEEQKWLIRLLLKSLGLGIGEQKIFGVLHPKAQDMYQRCSDLGHVCKLLADNTTDLNASSSAFSNGARDSKTNVKAVNLNDVIRPFHQIRPMLCERFPGDIQELMQSDVLYLETKMDGERFQLHIDRGRFMYISRNGVDYTRNFGDSYDRVGTLTPKLRGLLPLSLQSIILDGEMMVWDTVQQRFREKGENTDVKNLKPDRSWQPCFVVYDLLYFNGQSLLDHTYIQRAYKLQKLVVEQRGVLQLMRGRKIGSIQEFNELFQQALDSNAEGIVLKKQGSIYQPGVRLGGGWYKDKADYIKGLITEFDVLIIGGFYNRKRTFIESFLLGVLQPAPTGSSSAHRQEVFSIGCVTNNTKQRGVLNHTLKPHWHDVIKEPPPLWYHYKANDRTGCPDLWIEPHNSIILQVKAADLAPNSAFFTRKSLHFPRIEMKRDDKSWSECMTLKEFNDLCEGSLAIKKLNKRQLRLEDLTTRRKRLRMTPSERSRLGLAVYEKRCVADPNDSSSKLFDGLSFCILSGSAGRQSKQQLQELAVKNGGSIVENPLPNDPKCFCIAGDETFLVKRHILQEPRTCDIVSMEWLLRVCRRQELELRPKDLMAATEPLQRELAECFDRFGDSYNKDITDIDELQELLLDMEVAAGEEEVLVTELDALEDQLLEGKKNLNMFRHLRAEFYDQHGDPLGKILFLQNGGKLADPTDPRINLGFIGMSSDLDDNHFGQWLQSRPKLSADKVLNSAWIHQSHREGHLVPMHSFV